MIVNGDRNLIIINFILILNFITYDIKLIFLSSTLKNKELNHLEYII